jgi:hypothetical protein
MKSKTLIGIAVASTFGWSAASYAGAGHEVVTPFSPNESGEVIFNYKQGFDSAQPIGALSDSGSGTLTGSSSEALSSGTTFSQIGDESASLSMQSDSFAAAADEGIYSDYYLVSLTPVAVESWDYYVIDDGGSAQLVAISDYDVWLPTHELALIPSASDEMVYELVLVPTFTDDAIASWSDGSADAMGE